MTTRRALLGGAAALGLGLLGGCDSSSGGNSPSPTPLPGGASASPSTLDPVAVKVVLPGTLRLGVVVSLASDPDEGAHWVPGVEGAHVAAHRLARGGATVELVASNDKGTATGIVAAVQELVRQQVAGIVVATSGSHVTSALEPAAAAGVPLVFCHPGPASLLGAGVWNVAPTLEQVHQALVREAAPRTVLLDAGGGTLPGLSPAAVVRTGTAGPSAQQQKQLAALVRDPDTDVVVTGGPAPLAAAVAGLQGVAFAGRVLLGPAALSPRFAESLGDKGASLTQGLTTAGVATDDPAALAEGDDGRAVSQFLAAVRDAADGQLTSFFDGDPLRQVAWAADAASHDAVVTLACAAGLAVSTQPRDVLARLGRMQLSHHDGLVGPALDLRRDGRGATPAVPDLRVGLLHATVQDPGLRPPAPSGTPRLFWFADR